MNIDLIAWLGRAAAITIALSVISIGWTCFGTSTSPGRRLIDNWQKHLDQQLRFLQIRQSGRKIITIQITAVVALVSVAAFGRVPILALFALAVLVLPNIHLINRRQKRVADIEAQLDGWLLVLANALKVSTSLGEAIASSISVIQPPLSREVDLTLKEYKLGAPLDQALEAMAKRINSRSVTNALLTLRIGRNTGGDLASILATSASSLRELARLEGVARTKTAEGKTQAFVIAVIPFPLFGCLHWMDPGFFLPLIETFTGHLVLVGASALWLSAVLVARRVLVVDI
jgi:tight adherence protein B